MKKRILIASGLAFLQISGAGAVFAGGIDNTHNYSAEYIRTFNRNAATDSADIVVYNPAGTVLMDDGTYINLSLQYVDNDYKNLVKGTANGQDGTYSQDEPSIIPGLFGLYKTDKWSIYSAVNVPTGGGEVKYDQGEATIQILNGRFALANNAIAGIPVTSPSVEAESVGIGITLGGAYKVCDSAALSFGVRHVKSDKSLKMVFIAAGATDVTMDYEYEASGWAGIFGVNYSPTESINLAARYEMKTKLDYEYTIDSTKNSATGLFLLGQQGLTDKTKKRRDIPALLGLGGSYQLTPALKADINLTYYFNEDADWAGDENLVDNGYDVGISFEYTFNDKLRGSIGYMHTETGIDAKDTISASPKLDANSLGTGFAYKVNDKFDINFGVGIATYNDDSYVNSSGLNPLTIGYEKQVIFYSLGAQYKF